MFVQSKTKRRVEMPIHPAFQAWLAQIPEDSRVGYVFPSLAEKTSAGRNGLSGQFRLIMEKAEVKGEIIERKGEKGRNRSTFAFHSLRHSFNSAMANAGIPQEMRQRLTGHASKAVNDRYTHAELESLRKAVETVPQFRDRTHSENRPILRLPLFTVCTKCKKSVRGERVTSVGFFPKKWATPVTF